MLMLLAISGAQADTLVSGYVKGYGVSTRDFSQLQGALRVMVEQVGQRSAVQIHGEAAPVFTSRALPFANPTLAQGRSWRLTDPPSPRGGNSRHTLYNNIDRLNVQFRTRAGDLTVGRQAITFGMARVINPTDVFLPFDVRTFNTEYRIGVDALRFQRPFGQMGEIDAGVILGEDARSEDSAAFFQIRTNLDGRDVQLSAIRFAEQNLLGAGLQTAVGDYGFWLEAAAVSGDDDYVRVSTGFDYAFSEDIYGLLEYHFNGAGVSRETDYPSLPATAPYQRGGVFLLGRHYLIPAVSVQLSPLWSLSAQAIVNLSDGSAFSALSATKSVSQNLYADFGTYLFSGGSTTEYGSNPQTLYMSLRYYF